MLKSKRNISFTVTIAALTIIGNVALTSRCLADTLTTNLPNNQENLMGIEKYEKVSNGTKHKKHKKIHKRHNKYKSRNKYSNSMIREDFEIIKAPIRGIDFDVESITIVETDFDREGIPIYPIVDPYIDGIPVEDKRPTINPSDYDFQIIKAPIRGIDFDKEGTTVYPIVNPNANKQSVKEKEVDNEKKDLDAKEAEEKEVKRKEKEIKEKNHIVQPINKEVEKKDLHIDVKKDNAKEKLVKKAPAVKNVKEVKNIKEIKNEKEVQNVKEVKNIKKTDKKDIEKLNSKNELPKTGTDNFKNLLLGGAIFVLGVAMNLFSRKNRANNN